MASWADGYGPVVVRPAPRCARPRPRRFARRASGLLAGAVAAVAGCTGRVVPPTPTVPELAPVEVGAPAVAAPALCAGGVVLECGIAPLAAAGAQRCPVGAGTSGEEPCRQLGDLDGARVAWRVERDRGQRVVTVYRGDDRALVPIARGRSATADWQTAEVCLADVSCDGSTEVVTLLLDARNDLTVHVVSLSSGLGAPSIVSIRGAVTQRVGSRGCSLVDRLEADFPRGRLTLR
jgi:hypothetical protein